KLRSLHEYLSRYPAPLAVRVYGGMYEEHPVQVGEKTCRLVNVPYYATGLLHRYIAQAESTPEHGA
ncbi:MAG TPA: hypothetical protein PLJ32_08730, partial [Kiritimatiellia bacterium]|nr:hypothetical protein [Kiritimatiellia bacterium]HPC49417.1 hypothetical protein [Kiritimatiellia bacterium]HPK37902.1 hypothetical protein [Kiritimatiellia bacterium]HPW76051.1 hypothetical protein [Kiritimatiellia bacterium]